jgi:hypothetical protein
LKSRKYDICPTEKKCADYTNAGPQACTRCPKNLGYVDRDPESGEWSDVDDTDEIIFRSWINYIIDLWRRSQFFKIEEKSLTPDEVRGLLMVNNAVLEADRRIAEIRKRDAEIKTLGENNQSNFRH